MDIQLVAWARTQADALGLELVPYTTHRRAYNIACSHERDGLPDVTVFWEVRGQIIPQPRATYKQKDDLVPECEVITLKPRNTPRLVVLVKSERGTALLLTPDLNDTLDIHCKKIKRVARFAALGFSADEVDSIARAGYSIYDVAVALRLHERAKSADGAIALAATYPTMSQIERTALLRGVPTRDHSEVLISVVALLQQPYLLKL